MVRNKAICISKIILIDRHINTWNVITFIVAVYVIISHIVHIPLSKIMSTNTALYVTCVIVAIIMLASVFHNFRES